jgi:hypothetical protein
MARFAPVCPVQLYRRLKEMGDWLLGDYHLLLAHDVAAHADEYQGIFTGAMTVIMDNSMVELGTPVVDGALVEKATKAIGVQQIVVLPDIEGEGSETYRLSKKATKEWKFHEGPFMAVVQGTTLDEYVECYNHLEELPGVGFIGIPRSCLKHIPSRVALVEAITRARTPRWFIGAPWIHLLGFSPIIQDDIAAAQCSRAVMGIDSAVPTRMGQRRQLLTLDQDDPGGRGDYWDNLHYELDPVTIANLYITRAAFGGKWRGR